MVKCKGNRKSKRKKLSLKYNIQKRVNEHNRRLRKEGKKLNKRGGLIKTRKKDPGVPNNWPFKEQVLQDIARRKENREKEIEAKRKQQRAEMTKDKEKAKKEARRAEQERNIARKAMKEEQIEKLQVESLRRCLAEADVLLHVLDARDPLGSRCPTLEAWALEQGKRIVFVLTKADTVAPDVLSEWLRSLGRVAPTVAAQGEGGPKAPIGVSALLKMLVELGKAGQNVKFGLVGYLGSGKRSLQKMMRRDTQRSDTAKEARAASNAVLEPIGVLRPGDADPKDAPEVLRRLMCGSMTPAEVKEPVAVVETLLSRSTPMALMRTLKIASFEDVEGLLTVFGQDRHVKSKRGKVAPHETVAKKLIQELVASGIASSVPKPEELGASAWAAHGDAKSKLEAVMEESASAAAASKDASEVAKLPRCTIRTSGFGPVVDLTEALRKEEVKAPKRDVAMGSADEDGDYSDDEDLESLDGEEGVESELMEGDESELMEGEESEDMEASESEEDEEDEEMEDVKSKPKFKSKGKK